MLPARIKCWRRVKVGAMECFAMSLHLGILITGMIAYAGGRTVQNQMEEGGVLTAQQDVPKLRTLDTEDVILRCMRAARTYPENFVQGNMAALLSDPSKDRTTREAARVAQLGMPCTVEEQGPSGSSDSNGRRPEIRVR